MCCYGVYSTAVQHSQGNFATFILFLSGIFPMLLQETSVRLNCLRTITNHCTHSFLFFFIVTCCGGEYQNSGCSCFTAVKKKSHHRKWSCDNAVNLQQDSYTVIIHYVKKRKRKRPEGAVCNLNWQSEATGSYSFVFHHAFYSTEHIKCTGSTHLKPFDVWRAAVDNWLWTNVFRSKQSLCHMGCFWEVHSSGLTLHSGSMASGTQVKRVQCLSLWDLIGRKLTVAEILKIFNSCPPTILQPTLAKWSRTVASQQLKQQTKTGRCIQHFKNQQWSGPFWKATSFTVTELTFNGTYHSKQYP